MGEGPRDWSPPGYWDGGSSGRSSSTSSSPSWVNAPSPVRPRLRGPGGGILALLFGAGALVATLAPIWSYSPWRLVWTSLGLTAVFFGIRQLSLWRRGLARGRVPAWLGIGLGGAATALLVWGVLWVEVPNLPAPPQVAFAAAWPGGLAQPALPSAPLAPQATGQAAQPTAPATTAPHSYTLRSGRAVPPTANAREVEPAYQLQANLVATAYEICRDLGSYRQQYGALPPSLNVGGDGRISTDAVAFSAVLPAYMRLSYVPSAPDESSFLAVADTESGMAMSCVRSGNEVWIADN